MPLFSIILPVYNDSKSLGTAVKSVVRQKFRNFEIIIINDASTDDSGLIADKLSVENHNIRVIHNNSNVGVAKSRNRGLLVAKGNYIIFLDSDDMLLGECLDGLNQIIKEQSGVELIVGRWERDCGEATNSQLFEDVSVLKSNDVKNFVAHLNKINYLNYVCWHYIIKRQFLHDKKLQFMNVKIAEDQEFVTKLLCLINSVAYFNTPMYLYRGTGRLSKSMDLQTGVGFVQIIESLAFFLKDNVQLGVDQQRFILSRIKSISGMLIGRLTLLNAIEIEKLDEFIDHGIKRAFKIHEILRGLKLVYLVDNEEQERGLIYLKRQIENKVLSIVDKVRFSELYIFCASIDASSIGNILSENGYKVSGLVDNKSILNGKKQDGFCVYDSTIFSSKDEECNHDCFVIVCHQNVEVFNDIAKQLMTYGLREGNIKHTKPIWSMNLEA